jgi:hypothetical protein
LNTAKGCSIIFHFGVLICFDQSFTSNYYFNMLTKPKWLLLLVLLATQLQSLFAQTDNDSSSSTDLSSCTFSCCTTDLTPSGVMISHVHSKNEWMLSYRFMNMSMADLGTGTSSIDKEKVFNTYVMVPEKMNMQMHMLMAMYGITHRLTVMMMFNYQVNSMEMSMYSTGHVHQGSHADGSPTHRMQTNGIGDTKLNVLYGFSKSRTSQFLVSVGASLPTGDIQLTGALGDAMYPDANYPYGMQMGSGTLDIVPTINYLYQKNKLALSTSVSGTYRTGHNSVGYKLGNEAIVNSWVAYQWFGLLSSSVRLQGRVTGDISGKDANLYTYMEPSANPKNYGGQAICAYAGSTLHLKKALKNNRLSIECGIPVYQDLNGIQLKQQLTLNTSWSFSF